MDMNTHEPPHTPPPVPVGDDEPDPADEIDVDLADEQELEAAALARATLPEGVEFCGEFSSVEDYLRTMLEPELSRGCAWLLDCLDWDAVIERFEADGARYLCEHGHVYRIGGA
jgi:hypothetical protein